MGWGVTVWRNARGAHQVSAVCYSLEFWVDVLQVPLEGFTLQSVPQLQPLFYTEM